MSATQNMAPTPPHFVGRARAWVQGLQLGRILGLALAVAALIAVAGTFAAIRGIMPFGSEPGNVLIWLYIDFVVLLLLAVTLAWRVVALWVERRRGAAGSRLHVRLVRLFSFVSVVPAIIVAIASIVFFNYGLQSWLSDQVRTVLEESVAVADAYLHEHKQNIRADVLAMAQDLNRDTSVFEGNSALFSRIVDFQSRIRELSEAIVFDGSGAIRARSGFSFMLEVDPIPPKALEEARKGEVAIVTSIDDDRVRALYRLDPFLDTYLYVGRVIDPKVLAHTTQARNAVERFERLEFQRAGMQISFALVFAGVALVLLLAASWVGLLMATQLSRPLSALIAATERVRSGDLTARVPERDAPDEIGSLSRAFNRMTNDLEQNRGELLEANRQLDQRRRFTETVLEGVSSGVIGLDENGRVHLPNRSASDLLDVPLDRLTGRLLVEVIPEMAPLLEEAQRQKGNRPIEAEIHLQRAKETRTLLVRIAVERDGQEIKGFVVTFDDVTDLVAAQRKAAWADVARRIAHEIRNPLTPIQLSAERLKRKYLNEIASDRDTFETCTDTIVRHVGDIGRMVDEFSSFARVPAPVMRLENLNDLCRQAVFLQRNAYSDIDIETELPDNTLYYRCDGRQVSQALTNLILNAAEAIEGRGDANTPKGRILVRLASEEGRTFIEVEDNGKGLPEKARERLTEPYYTTRTKGTGLGLAIVRKIMEDHGGRLRLQDAPGGGARVRLELPGEPLSEKEAQMAQESPMQGATVVPGGRA
ncbi:MAG: PAS domain-containing sensor histidine kinase [Alphaproteobacteria bacterium]|nr:PAS domain-containing sensor histidine kinase [Alphaproteobacteria bacterium]